MVLRGELRRRWVGVVSGCNSVASGCILVAMAAFWLQAVARHQQAMPGRNPSKPRPPRAGRCAKKKPPRGPLDLQRYSLAFPFAGSEVLGYPLGSATRA